MVLSLSLSGMRMPNKTPPSEVHSVYVGFRNPCEIIEHARSALIFYQIFDGDQNRCAHLIASTVHKINYLCSSVSWVFYDAFYDRLHCLLNWNFSIWSLRRNEFIILLCARCTRTVEATSPMTSYAIVQRPNDYFLSFSRMA